MVNRTPVANQQLFVENDLNEQRHASDEITPKPEQREQARGESEFIEKESSRRLECRVQRREIGSDDLKRISGVRRHQFTAGSAAIVARQIAAFARFQFLVRMRTGR